MSKFQDFAENIIKKINKNYITWNDVCIIVNNEISKTLDTLDEDLNNEILHNPNDKILAICPSKILPEYFHKNIGDDMGNDRYWFQYAEDESKDDFQNLKVCFNVWKLGAEEFEDKYVYGEFPKKIPLSNENKERLNELRKIYLDNTMENEKDDYEL